MSDEIPDIYGDDVALAVHNHGIVITLMRVEPVIGGTGPQESMLVPAGRIRLPRLTAIGLLDLLGKALAQQQATEQAATQAAKIKH